MEEGIYVGYALDVIDRFNSGWKGEQEVELDDDSRLVYRRRCSFLPFEVTYHTSEFTMRIGNVGEIYVLTRPKLPMLLSIVAKNRRKHMDFTIRFH